MNIYVREKNAEGKWRYERVNVGRGRRPAGLEGPFYTRLLGPGKTDPTKKVQHWELLNETTLDDAIAHAEKLHNALDAKAKGLTVAEANAVDGSNRLTTKITAFCNEAEANKAKKTWQAYANSLRYFRDSCKRTDVQDIDRDDMLAFKKHLRNERHEETGEPMAERTIYNNFLNVMIFLKWCGVKPGIKKNDWPKKPEREPEEYTDEEIVALLGAAEPDERLILNSFLCSGLRSGEMAHFTYGDIDYKHSVWTVQPKGEWKTKTQGSQRDVPVPEWLTKKIHERKVTGKHQAVDLVFPNTEGNPNDHMIRIVKRVAKRAKVTGRVDDHKFRATAITRWLREGNTPQDVMSWVGHTSLATILRYAAKVNVRKAEHRKRAAAAFEQFAGVGD